jgi:hypothetical protein
MGFWIVQAKIGQSIALLGQGSRTHPSNLTIAFVRKVWLLLLYHLEDVLQIQFLLYEFVKST